MRRGPTGPCCSRRPFSRGSSRAARRRPAAGQAARRCAARHRRLRNPPGDDAADGGRRGRALRLQPAGARRLRGHRADAGRADLRRTAAGVVLRGARGHGLHRSRYRHPGAAVAPARRRGGERGLHVPDGVAHVGQGRPYLGLSRRHRRPAHPVRPVRVLHGPHARTRRSHPPPQGRGAPVIEGLVGLGIMLLLCALRVPIAFAMAIVGIAGYANATAATFAKVAYPSMKKFGYSDRLAAGVVAGGGTLGIMIPPSTIMVIYGTFTETNIGKLFAAGIVPGIVGAILLCGAVQYMTWRDPASGPRGERSSWHERLRARKDVWAVGALFLFVMGGIYGGLFTATEGAAMGAFGAMIFALWRRALTWRTLYAALLESARTTSMLFMILIGALIFAEFVNITTMPADLKGWVTRYHLSPTMVVAAICAIYVVLGTAMEELSMILLTIPVFFPVIVQLGFDPIWFGIIIVCVVEIGLISPPVGMNMFVLKTLLPEVSTGTIFSGVLPFMWADVVRLAILVAFPIISLWLPSMMR